MSNDRLSGGVPESYNFIQTLKKSRLGFVVLASPALSCLLLAAVMNKVNKPSYYRIMVSGTDPVGQTSDFGK